MLPLQYFSLSMCFLLFIDNVESMTTHIICDAKWEPAFRVKKTQNLRKNTFSVKMGFWPTCFLQYLKSILGIPADLLCLFTVSYEQWIGIGETSFTLATAYLPSLYFPSLNEFQNLNHWILCEISLPTNSTLYYCERTA